MCGGRLGSLECLEFDRGQWDTSHNLTQDKRLHTSWIRPDGRLLLVGGTYSTTKTESIDPRIPSLDPEEGFELPYDS